MAISKPLTITRGKTLQQPVRWETTPLVSRPISGISLATGFPRLTVEEHGLPDGWRGAVTRVQGMKQINAQDNPPKDSDYREVTVVDADTIEFNGLVPVDDSGKEWPAYTGGGFIQYYTPHALTGYTCVVVVKDKIGGTVLLSSRDEDAPMNLITADVDAATKTITILLSAADAAAIPWKKAVWEAEMHGPGGVVKALIEPSPVVVEGEVAT
jgi:hypothetical protein